MRVLLFLALLAAPLQAQADPDVVEGNTQYFHWQAPPELAEVARKFSQEADDILVEAHRWLGLKRGAIALDQPRPGDMFWVRKREGIALHLGHEVPNWFAAVALPGRGEVVLSVGSAGGDYRLRSTMRHELVHHALSALGSESFGRLPAWFHEGLAERFSGEIYLSDSGTSLAWGAANDALPWLSEYKQGFGANTVTASMGYALGHAFVDRLIREYGLPIVGEVLEQVYLGASLDQALIETTGLSVITHEVQMREDLASLRNLLGNFHLHLITALFLLASFLLPFVWRKKRRRERAMERKWEQQEISQVESIERLMQQNHPSRSADETENPPRDRE
jgi:peptidase MA superfamily protein